MEALAEAEGLATRPGPRPKVPAAIIETVREAIKACRAVTLSYQSRRTSTRSSRVIHPYGFIYGHRHYVIGLDPKTNDGAMRLFSLSGIENAVMTDQGFERDATFSLREYAGRSFGVFQEDSYDVVWRFSAEAATAAWEHCFHPTQVCENLPDGRLEVRFHAGGLLEMAWHLLRWGRHVDVVAPECLAALVGEQSKDWGAFP